MDRLLAFLIVPALLLSGCASSDPDAPAAPADLPPAEPSAGDPPAQAASMDAPQTVQATRTVEEEAIHMEGRTSLGGCAYASMVDAGRCQFQLGEGQFRILEGDLPQRLAGTVTWTALAPTSQELTVYILEQRDGGYWWAEELPDATGTSPLTFDFDLSQWESGLMLGVANSQWEDGMVAWATYQTPQPFVLDATYTSVTLSE